MKNALFSKMACIILAGCFLLSVKVSGAEAPKISLLVGGGLDSEVAKDMEASGIQYAIGEQVPYEQFNALIVPWFKSGEEAEKVYQYVKEGGGLLITGTVLMQLHTELELWNAFLKPLGAQYFKEVLLDKEHSYPHKRFAWQPFHYAWTTNIVQSPITEGVTTVWYPNPFGIYLINQWYGTHAMKLDENWQVVVKGMDSASSFPLSKEGTASEVVGMWEKDPPLLAVRQYGKGRIALFPVSSDFHLGQGNTMMVDGVVLKNGDGKHKSDTQKLIFNTLKWLAGPSIKAGKPGGYQPEQKTTVSVKPAASPNPVTWPNWKVSNFDHVDLETNSTDYVGMIGAHTNLSSGQGTVEDNVKAAKEAGYDFIAFTEDLVLVDEKEYEFLQSECKRLSDNKFLALPGLEVQMANGTKRLIFDCAYPDARFLSADKKIVGESYSFYSSHKYRSTVIYDLSHQDLPVWFFPHYNCFALQTYKGDDLIDDSVQEYFHLQENHASLTPVIVHLTYNPDEIKKARKTGMQTYVKVCPDGEWVSKWGYSPDWKANVTHLLRYDESLNGFFRVPQQTYVSSGPKLVGSGLGLKGDLPLDVSVCDRLRFGVNIQSDVPLKDVIVHDGKKIYQRFLPREEERYKFTRRIEDYHSKQWDWIVDAKDEKGGRLISSSMWTRVQRNFSQMCADEQNILGFSGLYFKCWTGITGFPPYPHHNLNIGGWGDLGASFSEFLGVFPYPELIEEGSDLPPDYLQVHPTADAHIRVGSGEITQIERNYQWLAKWGTTCDGPFPLPPHPRCEAKAIATTFFQARPSGDINDCYASEKAGISLLTVKITVLKDIKLSSSVKPNILSLWLHIFGSPEYDTLTYLNGEGKEVTEKREREQWQEEGELCDEVAYLALYPGFSGGLGVVCLNSQGYFRLYKQEKDKNTIVIGSQLPAEEIKKGTEFDYKFVIVRGKPGQSGDEFMVYFRQFLQDFGLVRRPEYKLTANIGKVISSQYVLNLQTSNYGFAGKIPQVQLSHEVLPVTVQGLSDNWDAGCYESNTQWLKRIPVRDGVGYMSLDPGKGDQDFYVGNLLVCDRAEIVLRLLDSAKDYIVFTAHNPTDQSVTCTVEVPSGFADYYTVPPFKKKIQIPAGTTLEIEEVVE